MEDKKEPIKIRLSTAILVFIIFILIVAIIGIIMYYNGNKEQNNTNTSLINGAINNDILSESNTNETNITNVQKTEELDINSELVQKLYNYILKDNDCVETIAYQSQKITIENLENQVKIMTIFENIDNSVANSTRKETLDYGAVLTHYYFKEETIENKAREIFGNDIVITHESISNLKSMYDVAYNNGTYEKTDILQGGGGFLWEDSTEKLIRAEKNGDEIYLYDKYIHVVRDENNYNINNVYNASDRKVLLASDLPISSINIDTIKNVNTFKHTFKKNSDGSYYWYSTEPVE